MVVVDRAAMVGGLNRLGLVAETTHSDVGSPKLVPKVSGALWLEFR